MPFSVSSLLARLSLLIASLAMAHAAEPPPAYAGVWSGTIGKSAVMVCLSSNTSQYYYRKMRKGLVLNGADATDPFKALEAGLRSGHLHLLEQKSPVPGQPDTVTGRWQMQPGAVGELVGTWSDSAGQKTWPVRLQRLNPSGPQAQEQWAEDCPSAYFQPLKDAVHWTTKPAAFAGKSYQMMSTPFADALQLPAEMPAARKINPMAQAWLKEQAVALYSCRINGGTGEDWSAALAPKGWNDKFLVLEDSLSEVFCGGAHGNASLGISTFDLDNGAKVNTWGWIKGGQKAAEVAVDKDYQPTLSRLRALLEKHNPRTDGVCGEAAPQMSIFDPYPTAKGLVFNTHFFHALRACNDEIILSWKQMAPFLTPAGQAAAQQAVRP